MEIRKCGSSWVYCDGKCENCLVSEIKTSSRTEEEDS